MRSRCGPCCCFSLLSCCCCCCCHCETFKFQDMIIQDNNIMENQNIVCKWCRCHWLSIDNWIEFILAFLNYHCHNYRSCLHLPPPDREVSSSVSSIRMNVMRAVCVCLFIPPERYFQSCEDTSSSRNFTPPQKKKLIPPHPLSHGYPLGCIFKLRLSSGKSLSCTWAQFARWKLPLTKNTKSWQ